MKIHTTAEVHSMNLENEVRRDKQIGKQGTTPPIHHLHHPGRAMGNTVPKASMKKEKRMNGVSTLIQLVFFLRTQQRKIILI